MRERERKGNKGIKKVMEEGTRSLRGRKIMPFHCAFSSACKFSHIVGLQLYICMIFTANISQQQRSILCVCVFKMTGNGLQ